MKSQIDIYEGFYSEWINSSSQYTLFEVSEDRIPILKKIDKHFNDLKKDPTNSDYKKQLVESIKEFTKINKIYLTIKKDLYNAGVIPVYNNLDSIAKKIHSAIDALFKGKSTQIEENNSDHISYIYLIIGTDLLSDLTSREMTAVLLHELGHVYEHTTTFPYLIQGLIRFIIMSNAMKTLILSYLAFNLTYIMTITGTLLLVTRSLTFLEHLSEHNADKYPTKYGYGDEMINLIQKFSKERENRNSQKNILRKIFDIIINFLFPSTHPTDNKRICYIGNEIQEKYISLYPQFKNELINIMSNIKCDNTLTKLKYQLGIN